MGTGGWCGGFNEWGAGSITTPMATLWLAPQQVVMPGVLITPSPALLSRNRSGHLVIPHLPTAKVLTALTMKLDLLGRHRGGRGKRLCLLS